MPLCISSTGGSGGKTLLTLGLGRAGTRAGIKIKPFKKGPDYIDSAWLSLACGVSATNLDLFFMEEKHLKELFEKSVKGYDLALVEGNRGLFDGLDENGSCSTAALARALSAPILLCIDCAKSTRTVAAILTGLLNFEKGLNFAGVILNRVGSARHEAALRSAIEKHVDIKILGALPRLEKTPIPERHMGLFGRGPKLSDHADEILDNLAVFISSHCDLHEILNMAKNKSENPASANLSTLPISPPHDTGGNLHGAIMPNIFDHVGNCEGQLTIGYIKDEAFWFYYPENIMALQETGVNIIELSLFKPEDINLINLCSGLYLGGGFPEDFAKEISQSRLMAKLAERSEQGMPIYAECGGLLLLCKELAIADGVYKMSGIFNASAILAKRPQGLGYVEAEVVMDNPFFEKLSHIKGHEFHYSRCQIQEKKPVMALKLKRGQGILNGKDGLMKNNTWASYLHIFAPACPDWANNFAKCAHKWKNKL